MILAYKLGFSIIFGLVITIASLPIVVYNSIF